MTPPIRLALLSVKTKPVLADKSNLADEELGQLYELEQLGLLQSHFVRIDNSWLRQFDITKNGEEALKKLSK